MVADEQTQKPVSTQLNTNKSTTQMFVLGVKHFEHLLTHYMPHDVSLVRKFQLEGRRSFELVIQIKARSAKSNYRTKSMLITPGRLAFHKDAASAK